MFRLYLEYARLISPDRDNGKMVRTPLLMIGGRLINRILCLKVNNLLVKMRDLLLGYTLRKELFLMLVIDRFD